MSTPTIHTIAIFDQVWAKKTDISELWHAALIESIGRNRYERTRVRIKFIADGRMAYRELRELIRRKPNTQTTVMRETNELST